MSSERRRESAEGCESPERRESSERRDSPPEERDAVPEAERDAVPEAEREALLTIAHGAVVTSGGYSAQRILLTAVEVILARGLGPVAYGVYAFAWRIAQLLVQLVTFGSMPALQRFLPAYADQPERRSAVLALAYITTLGFGILIAATIWVAAARINTLTVDHPSFPATMGAFGVLVLCLGLVEVTAGLFRAVKSARGEVVLNRLFRPLVRLLGAVGALALGYSVVGVAGGIVLATGLLVLTAAPLAMRMTGIVPRVRGTLSEARTFYNHAAPTAMSRLGKVFQSRIDVLLVGAILTAGAAGIYNAVLVLIAIAWIPLLSFNQLLPPVASDLYANDQVDVLNAVYTSVTRLILTTVVPIFAVLGVYGSELLAVFGPAYTEGHLPLVIYLGGVFVGSAVGATGWLMMMTDHQYARMALDWFLAVLNVVLTYMFVLEFGLVGAALGTSLAIAVQNGIQVLLLRRFEGLWPWDRTFLTPIVAGTMAVLAMWAVRVSVSGPLAVALGTVLGLAVYVGALLTIGVDRRDRLVVRELAAAYRTKIVG